ncbi:hypothetical protein IFR05_007669 [Cadophora sp. M221]|nr:hypothetical protein IFR05_007669 [Cadophora sp. M221]
MLSFDGIKSQFLEEEARKFHKSMTAAYKKTARRDARLDLEEDNRKELLKERTKLEAEMLGRQNEQMESYREQLRLKDAKIEKLEARSTEPEKDGKIKELEARLEASENYKKIKELETILAATMMEIEGLKKSRDA